MLSNALRGRRKNEEKTANVADKWSSSVTKLFDVEIKWDATKTFSASSRNENQSIDWSIEIADFIFIVVELAKERFDRK